MKLRGRLLALSISTVSFIVLVLCAIHVNSLVVTWLDVTIERSANAGGQIQALLRRRIQEQTPEWQPPPQTLAEAKKIWNQIASEDEDLAAALEQTMADSRSVIEIGIIGEDGTILTSSNPSLRGSPAVARPPLASLRTTGVFTRLLLLLQSSTDYETRIPIGIEGQQTDPPVFTIQVLSSPVLWRETVVPALRDVAFFSAVALALSIGLAWASADLALSPLKRISQSIDRLLAGESLETSTTTAEVAAVESKLTLLGSHLRTTFRDAESRRLAAITALTSGAAHEIKNPLNSIALRLDLLRDRIGDGDPQAKADVEVLSQEVTRLERVVRTFLDFAKPVELEFSAVDASSLVREVLTLIEPEAQQGGVNIETKTEPVRIRADADLLKQAILNVVKNAVQAMPKGGSLKAVVERSIEGNCRIEIADTGPGIAREDMGKLFKLYFTTKPGGSGIGLALAFRTVQLHGGSINVDSELGRGTKFSILIPGALA